MQSPSSESTELPRCNDPDWSAPPIQRASRVRHRAISIGLVVLMFSFHAILACHHLLEGRDIPLPFAVGATHFLLIPIILSLLDRFLARRLTNILPRTMVGAAVAAFAGGAAGVLLYSGLIPRVTSKLADVPPPPDTVIAVFATGAVLSTLIVGAWSLVAILPRMAEQEKVRALQIDNLELEAARLRAQGELARLRGQLEPHFLLNTLNLISGLVGIDVDKTRRTISNLGELLRDALEPHGEYQSLDDEIRWLERYSEILAARHSPRLAFEWEIDPRARDACLPRLLLQPLVENAIVHGALRASGKGIVGVRAHLTTSDCLEISVEDNGPGLAEPTRAGAIGVANVRRRLELTHPDAVFKLETGPRGTCALLRIPQVLHIPEENEQ